jgi:hypothetical protein
MLLINILFSLTDCLEIYDFVFIFLENDNLLSWTFSILRWLCRKFYSYYCFFNYLYCFYLSLTNYILELLDLPDFIEIFDFIDFLDFIDLFEFRLSLLCFETWLKLGLVRPKSTVFLIFYLCYSRVLAWVLIYIYLCFFYIASSWSYSNFLIIGLKPFLSFFLFCFFYIYFAISMYILFCLSCKASHFLCK